MSWLYKHRHQLDGLRPLIKIAHWHVITRVPPDDQDDVEQELVLYLMQTVEKHGNKGWYFLWKVAYNEVSKYFIRKYKGKRLCYIQESDRGERAEGIWVFLNDADTDARLDAIAILATLPERLIQIGNKMLDGEKLSKADQRYRWKQMARLRANLNRPRYARLSDEERRRILHLHSEGVSVRGICRTMGRSNLVVMRVLTDNEPLFRQNLLAKKEMEAKERDERIRHAYFVDGWSIKRIIRELHHDKSLIRRAIKADKGG